MVLLLVSSAYTIRPLNYSQRFSHKMHVIHGSSIIFDKLKFLLYKRYKLRAQQFQI